MMPQQDRAAQARVALAQAVTGWLDAFPEYRGTGKDVAIAYVAMGTDARPAAPAPRRRFELIPGGVA